MRQLSKVGIGHSHCCDNEAVRTYTREKLTLLLLLLLIRLLGHDVDLGFV